MNDLKGKKLLILGGAYQHRKIVKRAQELGIITYVTDYLEINESPAKKMADYPLMLNITDIDNIVKLCKREKIDGVLGPYLDVTQIPYQMICEALGCPCFGNYRQHRILTDKTEFKKFCVKNGADVIEDYTEKQVRENAVEYPVLIKPADSRGSRGQSVCFNRDEALEGINYAIKESQSGKILIEKYLGTENDIQLVYIVINGEPILYKVEDRYLGDEKDGLDKLCIATIAPSKHERLYRSLADEKVKGMIRKLGLKNSPVFIQCFLDGNKARLYDPGIRMPGDDYDEAQFALNGIDIPELLIRFALIGEMSSSVGELIRNNHLNGYVAMVLPCLKPGRISRIFGLDDIKQNSDVVTYSTQYCEGSMVFDTKNVKQRFGEFVIKGNNIREVKNTIEWLFSKLHIFDDKGNEMLTSCFDTKVLESYYN